MARIAEWVAKAQAEASVLGLTPGDFMCARCRLSESQHPWQCKEFIARPRWAAVIAKVDAARSLRNSAA